MAEALPTVQRRTLAKMIMPFVAGEKKENSKRWMMPSPEKSIFIQRKSECSAKRPRADPRKP